MRRSFFLATSLLAAGPLGGCGGTADDESAETLGSESTDDDSGGTGGTENDPGAGGSGDEPWRTETDPIELCWAYDEAFCDQFTECYGENFSSNICIDAPSGHIQCGRATGVSDDYIACMDLLTTPPCIGALTALCDGVILLQ